MSNSTNSSSTSRPVSRENISYALYLHRQELERPKRCRRLMRVASTKLQLTNELIWLHARRQWLQEEEWEQGQLEQEEEAPRYQQQCNALNRERQYRDILERNMQQQLQKQQQKKRQHLEATLKQRH